LHSNYTDAGFTKSNQDRSIPVKEILPQGLNKDMSASQPVDFAWSITKGPTPATLDFGNTCAPDASLTKTVSLKVEWKRLAGTPGSITVITHIYATNPTSRSIQINVSDVIRSGTTALDTATAQAVIPKNTANFLVLTHTFTVPSGTTDLNDVATASY